MRRGPGAGLGSSTLIILFSVLCLTVFAVLSLSSARAELSLAYRYADSVQAYYRADARATQILASLKNATDIEAQARRLGDEVLEITVDAGGTAPGDVHIRYSCPVSDTLMLGVSVYHQGDSGRWTVLRWELADRLEWSPDEGFRVWPGEQASPGKCKSPGKEDGQWPMC